MLTKNCPVCSSPAKYNGVLDGFELWWCSACKALHRVRGEPIKTACTMCGKLLPPELSPEVEKICADCKVKILST